VAIDPAGNTSPMARFVYRIAPAAPSGGGVTPSALIPLLPVGQQQVQGVRAAVRPAVAGLTVAVVRGHGGLRLTMRLGGGAGVVRFQVFRVRHGRPSRSAIVTVTRPVPAGGRYAVTLRSHALRVLRPGRYVVEARAGASRETLGPVSRRSFVVG
jgi:hypothetical protein